MFSNTKANSLILLVPFVLLLFIIALLILIFSKVNSENKSTTSSISDNTSKTSTSTTPVISTTINNTQQSTSTNNQNSQDSLSKAMNSVPAGYYPENKCPKYLILESSNSFAVDGEQKYSLSASGKTWIQGNCTDTKTLNY